MIRATASFLLLTSCLLAQTTITLEPAKDTSLFEDATGSLSNGAGTSLFFGLTGANDIRRALVQFDLTAVPAGATVVAASLDFFVDRAGGGTDTILLHRMTSSWGEAGSVAGGAGGMGAPAQPGDATWLHSDFPGVLWSTPGGDFETTPTTTAIAPPFGALQFADASLVSDVQAWVDGLRPNDGWMLRGSENLPFSARRTPSRESASGPDRPRLTITYTSAPAASVVSRGTGCSATAGAPFTLATAGLPILGNGSFALMLGSGPASSPCDLYLSNALSATPTPIGGGCDIWIEIPGAIALINSGASPVGPFGLSPSGDLILPLPLPADPTLGGLSVTLQAFAISPLATASAGFVTSNALSFTIGV